MSTKSSTRSRDHEDNGSQERSNEAIEANGNDFSRTKTVRFHTANVLDELFARTDQGIRRRSLELLTSSVAPPHRDRVQTVPLRAQNVFGAIANHDAVAGDCALIGNRFTNQRFLRVAALSELGSIDVAEPGNQSEVLSAAVRRRTTSNTRSDRQGPAPTARAPARWASASSSTRTSRRSRCAGSRAAATTRP